jgi:hypothetical protein
LALNQLQVQKEAANRAGVFVVAVLNPIMAMLVIEGANLILGLLSEIPLSALLDKVQ